MKEWNVSRKTIDSRIKREHGQHVIDEYWAERGLNRGRLEIEATGVVFKCGKPRKEGKDEDQEFFRLSENYEMPSFITRESSSWQPADLGDKMHCKSLHKRIASKKIEPNIKKVAEFNKKVADLFEKLGDHKMTEDEKIIKALATPGTAGQFAKGSQIEKLWKDKESLVALAFWKSIARRIKSYTAILGDVGDDMAEYKLYRKREALPVDEEGNVKVTRLMNSPSLVIRTTDSTVFTECNEAVADGRGKITPVIGINIFQEMKMIMVEDRTRRMLELDLSDFDGGQLPSQMYACCEGRVKWALRHGKPIEDILYLLPRYDQHVFRYVTSNDAVGYQVFGQLASGDIVTSDDNSAKTAVLANNIAEKIESAVAKRVSDLKNEIKKNEVSTLINNGKNRMRLSHGDDTNITIDNELEMTEIEPIARAEATQLGWVIKEGSLLVNEMKQDGNAKFLSHGVTLRCYRNKDRTKELEFAVLTRDKNRLLGKWDIGGEYDRIQTPKISAKLSSKYLSYWHTQLGHPDIMVASMYALICLRTGSSEYVRPYTWSGLQGASFSSMRLNDLIKLQIPFDVMDERWEYIVVTKEEEENIMKTIGMMNETLACDKNREIKTSRIRAIIDNSEWNYEETARDFVRAIMALDRASRMKKQEETEKWWLIMDKKFNEEDDDEENNKKAIEDKETTTKTQTCGHVSTNNTYTGRWPVKIHCETCWKERKEIQYEKINVCVKSINKSEEQEKNRVNNLRRD